MERLSRLSSLILITGLTVCFGNVPAQAAFSPISPEILSSLDSDEGLASRLGTDRLGKYLIKTATTQDQISSEWLRNMILTTLKSGASEAAIRTSLEEGDDLFASALKQFLANFNFSQDQIGLLLIQWQRDGIPPEVQTVLSRADLPSNVCDPLATYLLTTANRWPRIVRYTQRILERKEEMTPEEFISYLTEAYFKVPVAGDFVGVDRRPEAGQSLLFEIRNLLQQGGPLAHDLEEAPEERDSWYSWMWEQADTRWAQNALLLEEFVQRLKTTCYLHDEWKQVLAKAIADFGDDLLNGYVQAALIPGSRFSYVVGHLGGRISAGIDDPNLRVKQLKDNLVARIKRSGAWGDYILWQLTRPAEALTLTLRQALPSALKDSPALTRQWTQVSQQNPTLAAMLDEAGAWDSLGSAESFLEQQPDHSLDPRALQFIAERIGTLLNQNDQAWDSLIEQEASYRPLLQDLIAHVIETDNRTTLGLLATLRTNDQNLQTVYTDWITKLGQKSVADGADYLNELQKSVETGDVVGNTQLASFKAVFIQFLHQPDGWNAFLLRLRVESTLVNSRLRQALLEELDQSDADPWTLLQLTFAYTGPSFSLLHRRLLTFVQKSALSQMMLKAASHKSRLAINSLYTVWPQLLDCGAPTLISIEDSISREETLSDLYTVASAAFLDSLKDPHFCDLLQPASSLLVGQSTHSDLWASVRKILATDARAAQPLFRILFQNQAASKIWQRAFVKQIRFNAKAYVVADHLLANPSLQPTWRDLLSENVALHPFMWHEMDLALRQDGGVPDSDSITLQHQLIHLVLLDRVFFEQLLASQDSLFRIDFKQALLHSTCPNLGTTWNL